MQDLDVYKLQLIIWPNRDDRLLELYTNYTSRTAWAGGGSFRGRVNMIWKQPLGSHSSKETRKNLAHRQVWCFWRLKDNPFCNLHIPPPQSLALGSWQCRYNFWAVEIASFEGNAPVNWETLLHFQTFNDVLTSTIVRIINPYEGFCSNGFFSSRTFCQISKGETFHLRLWVDL